VQQLPGRLAGTDPGMAHRQQLRDVPRRQLLPPCALDDKRSTASAPSARYPADARCGRGSNPARSQYRTVSDATPAASGQLTHPHLAGRACTVVAMSPT